jgi:hypothetical protein
MSRREGLRPNKNVNYDRLNSGEPIEEEEQQPKKVKKYKHLEEIEKDIGLKFTHESGLYSFSPYKPVVSGEYKGYCVFKIGMSSSKLGRRYDNYITYFPRGVFFNSFIINVGLEKKDVSTIKSKMQAMEKFIFNYLEGLGRKKFRYVNSGERIKNGGDTEWCFTKPEYIDEAFKRCSNEFGGSFLGFETDFNNEVLKEYSKEINGPNSKVYFEGNILFC